MPDDNNQNKAFLSFFLGPVQPFIAAARTVRDLWTGSYLLSWLTVAAMEPVLRLMRQGQAEMITPHISADNPMVVAYLDGRRGNPRAAVACIPTKFAAMVPAKEANDLVIACLKAHRDEWATICGAVHDQLAPAFGKRDGEWDRNWHAQVGSYFEVRCVALPIADCGATKLDRLRVEPGKDLWTRQMKLLGALMDMAKSVRHVPPYAPEPDAHGRIPVKCSILGSFEQMGPSGHDTSRDFWGQLASPNWSGLSGTRLQKNDRLCALSLVKRFAWPAYFAPKLDLDLDELRFSDTATVAARRWLAETPILDPDAIRKDKKVKTWNGQWLHWARDNQGEKDGDPSRPPWLGQLLRDKALSQGSKPPTYYALLLMDGDDMGKFFRGELGPPEWEQGVERYREITRRLTAFALDKVQDFVEENHDGELMYAGGDDVLAMVPASRAIGCALALRKAYQSRQCMGESATISAGIAVVHIKEDLRFALQTVREAEKTAKHFADKRKDALALTVCRRSGEHTTAVMAWPHTEFFNQLVEAFRAGASDRWAYKLRREVPTLSKLPWVAGAAEVNRLLGRAEGMPKSLPDTVQQFMQDYYDEMVTRRGREGAHSLEDFVALCQSASFLARGRD